VDGQYLNYDASDALRTTDFTGLCAAMLDLQPSGKKIGKHSSVGPPFHAAITMGTGGTGPPTFE